MHDPEGVKPDTWSVRDDDDIVHAIIAHPDNSQFCATPCAAWRSLRVHTHMGKRKPVEAQPVTCLFCLTQESIVDMPQYAL